MFHIVIHALPDRGKKQDEEALGASGAYVSCLIDFEASEGAELLARHYIREAGWIPMEGDKMTVATKGGCSEGEDLELEYFEQAEEFGYCLSFHLYQSEEDSGQEENESKAETKVKIGEEPGWYGAKTLYKHNDFSEQEGMPCYEERVVIFWAEGFEQAIAKAETEANEYIEGLEASYLGFVNVFHTFLDQPGNGSEVYSIMRNVEMDKKEFIDHFYDEDSIKQRSSS